MLTSSHNRLLFLLVLLFLSIRLWTSPYLRARQTAEIIAENAEGWVTDIRENIFLVEQQFGLFEGCDWYSGELDHAFPRELHYYQKAAAFGGRFWAKIPLGESRFDVCQRVYSSFGTFQRDAKRHGITNLVIVAHGITLRAFLMMWLHLSPEWFEEEPNPSNCSIRVIDNGADKGYIWPFKTSPACHHIVDDTHPSQQDLLLRKESALTRSDALLAIISKSETKEEKEKQTVSEQEEEEEEAKEEKEHTIV
ncbi:Histidine phosphatase family protein, variant 3 [Balamuthia mandrillaris]